MALSLEPETPEHIIARLELELWHVAEQSRVAHAMAQEWKRRALAAEAQCRRWEQRVARRQRTRQRRQAA